MADPKFAAGAVVDTLRHMFSTLGAMLGTPAGQTVAQDAAAARSLPALGNALKRLWFATPLEDIWDSKEQVAWLGHLLAVSEGSREGLISFYGAGLLLCDALLGFAQVAVGELDESWLTSVLAVQDVLRGRHWEQLQQWPADFRCGGGSDPLLSTDRLPSTLRRTLDLEGVKLTKTQAAGFGAVMLMPGGMTLTLGGVGAAVLVKKARQQLGSRSEPGDGDAWDGITTKCLKHAHVLLRRKACPIIVRLAAGPHPLQCVKVSLYSVDDHICAMPVGGFRLNGTGGQSSARLAPGERCCLQPPGSEDSFRLRIYQPAPVLDLLLHDGATVRRGDRILIEPTADGQVRCFAESKATTCEAETGDGDRT